MARRLGTAAYRRVAHVLPVLSLVLLGCDSDEPASSPGGLAGGGGTAGATGQMAQVGSGGAADGGATNIGGGGVGGASPETGPAADAACRLYISSQCERFIQCQMWDEVSAAGCHATEERCPEHMLAPGSGYTVQSLNDCALAWQSFDCALLLNGASPACVTPGTRDEGEPCRYRTQCASQVCAVTDASGCGTCVATVVSGAPCIVREQCTNTHLCHLGACQQLQAWPIEEQVALGEPCVYDGKCQGVCAPTDAGDRCVETPGEGEPCVAQGPSAGARRCARGHYCSPENTCLELPGVDEPCAEGLLPCAQLAYCDSADGRAPGTCRAFLPVGAPCALGARNHACWENTFCQCIDAACTSGLCLFPDGTGTSCEGGEACPAGTECTSGLCSLSERPAECAIE